MKYDIPHALQSLKPGAEWTLRGSDYSGLEWLDSSQTIPTEEQVTAKIAALDALEARCDVLKSESPDDDNAHHFQNEDWYQIINNSI